MQIKHKRLDRDTWTIIRRKRYAELPLTMPGFCGTAALLMIDEGGDTDWDIFGCKVPIARSGMVWLELVPAGEHLVITAMLHPLADTPTGQCGYEVVEWYLDLTDGTYTAPDGVTVFCDLFLDLIFSDGYAPVGLPPYFVTDDRDELDAALTDGTITREQYDRTLAAADAAREKYAEDIPYLRRICFEALSHLLPLV
ncbi:MAG: DUF402 domain-containing protein [Clostridia bacterium]|nr:DUF402 domain-containing protein [Clostridia bacterium]